LSLVNEKFDADKETRIDEKRKWIKIKYSGIFSGQSMPGSAD
jgi:hypothetical protein